MKQERSSSPRRPLIRKRFLVAIPFLMAITLTVAAKATIDFDPTIDFSKYKTYAYQGGLENLVSLQVNPDLINTRMHRMVVREMEKKGLREVNANQNPDLLVRYWANGGSQVNVTTMGDWGPYGPYITGNWSHLYETVTAASTREGALILDVIDIKTKQLAWRVYVVRKMSDPDKDWKKADDDFAEGFKSFPPSEKEKDEKRREREKSTSGGKTS